MKIVLKNAYIVDHENSSIEYNDIKSNEFYYYVRNLLIKIDESKKSSDFKIRNCGTTEVINQCKLITETCFRERDDSKEEIDFKKISQNTKIIAERFLEKESYAQEKVNRMNVKIKVGCLIFAVIQVGDRFQLLIAKLYNVHACQDTKSEIFR